MLRFTDILSFLKLNEKEIRWNKELGTSRIEDHSALTDCAKSLLLETLADLKRDLALTLHKIL